MTNSIFLPTTYSKGMSMLLRTLLIFGLLSVSWTSKARADLIIDVQDATLTAGGTGVVDVYVRSNGTDSISTFNLEFQITGFHPSGSLRFSSIQSNAVQQATAPNYIFLNASSSSNFGYARQDPVLTTLIGGDQRIGNTNTTVTSSNLLLARLAIEHQTPTPLTASGVYQLSLVGANSLFADSNFTPLNIQSSTPGTITVTAVPEPSSGLLLGTCLCAASLKRRRKKCATNNNPRLLNHGYINWLLHGRVHFVKNVASSIVENTSDE
jgi:hypothetical protein